MTEGELLSGLIDTDSANHVGELLVSYESAHADVGWRPVGDRANNSGTIQVAGDPARALIERITNAIDAVIERAHADHRGRPTCTSPREAAQAWFGVPSAGLHELSDGQARTLAQNSVWVTLYAGDGRARRTVDIADRGLGLTAEQMPDTILSLNAENKMTKFYLAGAFGQGGSATFASSEYTLIASRAVGAPGIVAFTVVKYQSPRGLKLGSYVYLVRRRAVLTTTTVPKDFGSFSTRVRHYGYDLDVYNSPLGPNSMYGRCQAILFEPVLPFWFQSRLHNYGRTIKGSRTSLNGAREEGDPDARLSHSSPLFFSDLGEFGQLGIEYWVLEPTGKSAPNKAFVNGAKPIVLTVNGQTHAEWTSHTIRKDAELVHLASRMVVHLDCNRLSAEAKRILFVSTREESRKGAVQSLLLQELLGALKTDPKLAELEEQARLAGVRERDEKAEKEVRKEVARMLRLFGFSVAEEAATAARAGADAPNRPARGKRTHPAPEPIRISEPPTFVEFVGEGPVSFFPGQRRYIRVRTDAHSKYHNAGDPSRSAFNFLVDGEAVRLAGTSELRDGHMRAIFAADAEARVGAMGRLGVELRLPHVATMSASLEYKIVDPPPAKGSSATINLPEIDCQPVDSPESEEWISLGWGEDITRIAADYVFFKARDTLQIRYSTVFPRYESIVRHLTARDPVLAGSFKKRYAIWLITSVLIHWQDTESDTTKLGDEDVEQEKLDDYRRDEIRRLAKAAVIYAQREVTSPLTVEPSDTE